MRAGPANARTAASFSSRRRAPWYVTTFSPVSRRTLATCSCVARNRVKTRSLSFHARRRFRRARLLESATRSSAWSRKRRRASPMSAGHGVRSRRRPSVAAAARGLEPSSICTACASMRVMSRPVRQPSRRKSESSAYSVRSDPVASTTTVRAILPLRFGERHEPRHERRDRCRQGGLVRALAASRHRDQLLVELGLTQRATMRDCIGGHRAVEHAAERDEQRTEQVRVIRDRPPAIDATS